jgi:hypothetical protein
VGLIKRDARAVSAIRAGVNGQGVGEHLHPYHKELESAEKENTRSRSCSQSKSRPAQRVGVVRVSDGNANGARGYTAADGKGLEDDERKKRFLCYICMDYVQLS